eukprot:scaffold195577_cov23-Tisochrysis_lutea.AAC.2
MVPAHPPASRPPAPQCWAWAWSVSGPLSWIRAAGGRRGGAEGRATSRAGGGVIESAILLLPRGASN